MHRQVAFTLQDILQVKGDLVITIFNRKSLYFGNDMKEVNRIRDILDKNSVKYNYKIKNRMNDFGNRGSVRSSVGSLGNNVTKMYKYEIFVHRNDLQNAEKLIR